MALTARGVCFAMALVVVACGDDGPATVHDVVNDVDTASDTTPDFLALPGPQPRFGPRVSFYDAPVPAPDLLASGHPDLTLFPREMGGFVDGLVALTETTDGASLAGSVFFALTAPLPEGALAKLEATFIDLDDQTTRPARLGFELDGGPHGAPNLLSAQPIQGLALLPGRRYALAVYMAPELRSTLGRPALFADLLAGRETPGFDAEPWKPALAAARASNPDESSLFALTTFTTQRTTDGLMTFLEAARTHPMTVSTPTRLETHDRFCVYRADLELPDFQHGPLPYANPGEGVWRMSEGVPELARMSRSRLFITVPRNTVPDSGAPFVVFIRTGGGGDRPLIDRGPRGVAHGEPIVPTGTGPAMHIAAAGFAALTWDGPHGGPDRNPSGQDEQFLMFNVLNLAGTRDSIRQTALEAVLVRELAATLTLDTHDCDGASETIRFDMTRTAIMGHSMGAWVAPLALAASGTADGVGGFGSAILSGAGSGWMPNIVYKKSPLDVRPLAEALLGYTMLGRELTMRDPVLTLLQWAGETADPQSYAHLARPQRNILMIEGIVDTYILPPISQGTSLGLHLDLAGPAMDHADPRLSAFEPLVDLLPLAGLAQAATPLRDNRQGYTAAVVHAPGDTIEDGHEAAFQTPGPKHQYRCFLETLVRDGVPTLVTPSTDEWESCP